MGKPNVRPRLPKYFEPYTEQIKQLTSEDLELIFGKSHAEAAIEAAKLNVPITDVSHYWYKGKNFSLFIKNKGKTYEDVRDEVIREMKKYAPRFPKIKRDKHKDSYLKVIDPADIHIGKLSRAFETGEDYDSETAVKRVKEGVKGVLQKMSGWKTDKFLLVIGNDILHIDSPKRTTTSGTPQDTCGMWYDNFLKAKRLYVDIIETLLSEADVHVVFNPSNHDYMNGFFLADVIQTWFKNCKNVSFDCDISHRKYFKYHNNLIGTTHGDGAKQTELPLLMAQEAKGEWATTDHRYIYSHHLHHKTAKDYAGVTVETLRSPSSTDSWHHRNGYQHAPKAVEGFVHDKQHGQIARITHIF